MKLLGWSQVFTGEEKGLKAPLLKKTGTFKLVQSSGEDAW
jgi:hypothetical protein